jgi:hypothetical protein
MISDIPFIEQHETHHGRCLFPRKTLKDKIIIVDIKTNSNLTKEH